MWNLPPIPFFSLSLSRRFIPSRLVWCYESVRKLGGKAKGFSGKRAAKDGEPLNPRLQSQEIVSFSFAILSSDEISNRWQPVHVDQGRRIRSSKITDGHCCAIRSLLPALIFPSPSLSFPPSCLFVLIRWETTSLQQPSLQYYFLFFSFPHFLFKKKKKKKKKEVRSMLVGWGPPLVIGPGNGL